MQVNSNSEMDHMHVMQLLHIHNTWTVLEDSASTQNSDKETDYENVNVNFTHEI